MIETNFEKNKSLALLIKKYKELLKDRNIFIEDQIYVEILKTIGEIIKKLKYINEIDINRLEPLEALYKNIVKRYKSLFQEDINSKLDKLNNLMQCQHSAKSIKLGEEESINNDRTSNEVIKLSDDIDMLINYVDEIIKIVDKYYKLSELIAEKEPNESTTEIAPISSNVNKQSFFSKIFNKIKEIFGIKKDKVVAESPYIEVDKNEKFREQYLIKDSKINLQHIQNEEINDYIDGKKGSFSRIDELFYGLSKPREIILENNDNYYYLEEDDDSYIIADKTNKGTQNYKNTDTIICSDDNQYFRIVSDDTTIVYEEYKAETDTDNCNLFIRQPLNSKDGRLYIKFIEQEKGSNTEYYIEEERNGMCSINIQSKGEKESLYMQYESKDDVISGKKPKRIVIENVLVKTEFEKENRIKYKGKYYMYLLGKSEWDEPMNLDKKEKFISIFEKYGYIIKDIDPSIININIVSDGIKAVIPDRILEIYSKIHPEIVKTIGHHGKEIEEKDSIERY